MGSKNVVLRRLGVNVLRHWLASKLGLTDGLNFPLKVCSPWQLKNLPNKKQIQTKNLLDCRDCIFFLSKIIMKHQAAVKPNCWTLWYINTNLYNSIIVTTTLLEKFAVRIHPICSSWLNILTAYCRDNYSVCPDVRRRKKSRHPYTVGYKPAMGCNLI